MKKIGLKIFCIVLLVIFLIQSNIVIAVTQQELQQEKNSTKNQINKTQEELQDVKEEKQTVQKQVEELNTQISQYQQQISDLNSQIEDLNNKIEEDTNKIKEKEEDYSKQEKLLNERLIATYEAGETSYLDFILSSESLTDLISNYYLVTEIASYDTEFLNKIQEEKTAIENAKKDLEDSKSELDTAKASKQATTTQLSAAKSEKDAYVGQLSQSEQELQKQIEELQAHESSISSRIKRMQEEYDRKLAANNVNSNQGGGQQTNGRTSSYGFGWPVSNPSIGTYYGSAGSMWSSGYHTGVDFRASTGTPVYAVGDGQVVDTGYNRAYGNFVEIYHGKNVYSFYAHASGVLVSYGQNVSKGQQIMSSGATGNVTGPHLHFEIRTPGSGYSSCVNPMPYLP